MDQEEGEGHEATTDVQDDGGHGQHHKQLNAHANDAGGSSEDDPGLGEEHATPPADEGVIESKRVPPAIASPARRKQITIFM